MGEEGEGRTVEKQEACLGDFLEVNLEGEGA